MKPVFAFAKEQNLIGAAAATLGLFKETGGVMLAKLFTNDMTPNVNSVLADFTEAAYSGYAAAVLPAPTVGLTPGGLHQLCYFGIPPIVASGEPDTAITVYGYYVVYNTSPDLVMSKRFDHPVSVHLGIIIPIEIAFILPPDLTQDDGIAT